MDKAGWGRREDMGMLGQVIRRAWANINDVLHIQSLSVGVRVERLDVMWESSTVWEERQWGYWPA